MRHGKIKTRLNRTSSHRAALLRNMASSLIEYERIETTLPKAKVLRSYVERLITLGKSDNVARRRLAFARLRSKKATTKLFKDLGPRFIDRPGGYVRIIKTGYRAGDASPLGIIEFISKDDKQS
ncbi:MAG: 50S ribosomal protein L17 [Deltaproteobacteria bacterium]|jgi:LSU ribosomal protein L17P|uniref:Large ribosomal subunit protein bL17 n=1 Tax=Candidatus Acidulodesulfobacterium acidiphilum TaxID=2597224 RepID=A0A520XCV5_9DELT|nr:50S ribosomal protein L17 [Deltaproteobacteria bacterium]MCL6120056.1 50S ribosomal protein L17 [Deltaproteobacteria bacterium]MDA8299900.1 50S ribosomal protein L17 [Deltaproteobacteria bacterium]RZV38968.1 MAG: 50S ribosomal protein L17 [Candidatus Acidulodesulfobacterium acidiphilum]